MTTATVRFTALNTIPSEDVEKMVRDAIQEHCPDINLELLRVSHENHKPHPYIIGPQHIAHACDNHCGMLGLETMKAIPSATWMRRLERYSGTRLEDITFDVVAFIQLTDHMKQSDMVEFADKVLQPLEDVHLSGMCLVETKEKYRIT